MTDADKKMNPQHVGSDPADDRIRISPEIHIRTPDYCCLRFQPWRRFALSQQSNYAVKPYMLCVSEYY